MIGREILGSFCVNYFEFELLKEENLPEQFCIGIFFSKEIFEGGVIRIHNAFVQDKFFNPSDVLACLDFGLFLMLRWSALWLFHAFFVDKFQQRVGYDVMVRVSTIRKTASPARNLPTNLDIFMALGLLQKVLSSPAFLSFSSFIALSPSFSSFPHLRVGLRFCLEGGVSWLSCAGQYVCEADIEYLMELRYKADSSDWTDVLSYFYREAADEDRRIATKLNRLREEILIVCEKRRNLADELKSIRGIIVVRKAAEFVTDTLRKDNVQVSQLREVESQMEFRALEKDLFVQKLVGNVPALVRESKSGKDH
ncbi:hypothetical protein Tco_0491076 [Tanacetum coccineum]